MSAAQLMPTEVYTYEAGAKGYDVLASAENVVEYSERNGWAGEDVAADTMLEHARALPFTLGPDDRGPGTWWLRVHNALLFRFDLPGPVGRARRAIAIGAA